MITKLHIDNCRDLLWEKMSKDIDLSETVFHMTYNSPSELDLDGIQKIMGLKTYSMIYRELKTITDESIEIRKREINRLNQIALACLLYNGIEE